MVRARWGLAIALLLSAACGDDDDGGAECGEGTVEVDGVCVPTGDGECGAGTRPDGAGGCVGSNLPSDRRSCIGRFGPIAEGAANTVFVDIAFTGSSDGTAAAPFTDVQAGVDAAAGGDTVAIAEGTYPGDVDVDYPVAIEGRCARLVTIEGTVTVDGAAGSAIRGVRITSGEPGVAVLNAPAPGAGAFGLDIQTSIVEMNGGAGVSVDASSLSVTDSEIRLTQTVGATGDVALAGSGLYVFNGSDLYIASSIVEMNGAHGIDFADATGTPDTFAAPDGDGVAFFVSTALSSGIVEMNGIFLNAGDGVRVHAVNEGLPDSTAPFIGIVGNIVEMNGGHGASVQAGRADISGNTFTGNATDLAEFAYAVAASDSRLSVTGNEMSGTDGSAMMVLYSQVAVSGNTVSEFPNGGIAVVDSMAGATIANNYITGVGNVGVLVYGGDGIVIDGNEIAETNLGAGADFYEAGHGIFVTRDVSTEPSFLEVRNNIVRDNAGSGITLAYISPDNGVEPLYLVDGNEVLRNGNSGINVQFSGDGDIVSNLVEDNARYGIRGVSSAIGSARLRIFDNLITGTTATATDDDGDGIALDDSHVGVGQTLDGNNIQASARSGIVITGDSSGFCDENQIGDIDSNGEYDLLIEGLAAELTQISSAFNSTGVWGVQSSDSEIEPVDATEISTQPQEKPLQGPG
jgi:hypothetical protein